MQVRVDENNWCRCGKCGHKLGRLVGKWQDARYMPAVEIKCHSCKSINYIMTGWHNTKGGE